MSIREEFEAWYMDNWGFTEDDIETLFERSPDCPEDYYRLGVRLAHHSWLAATQQSEAKCAALAAELNAVEAIHNDAVFITDDHYEQCPPEVQEIICSLAVMQIPAYKAFLAEVRAQGVEMFGNLTIKIGEEEGEEDIVYAGKQALLYAAQLRQEAQ